MDFHFNRDKALQQTVYSSFGVMSPNSIRHIRISGFVFKVIEEITKEKSFCPVVIYYFHQTFTSILSTVSMSLTLSLSCLCISLTLINSFITHFPCYVTHISQFMLIGYVNQLCISFIHAIYKLSPLSVNSNFIE